MGSATATAQEAVTAVKTAAKNAEEQIRSSGEEVYASAKGEAERYAVERRDGIASYVRDLADALGSASDTLEERGRGSTAHFTRRAADEIHAFSDRVTGQDVSGVIHTVEDFARRRPGAFFGGAFLVSFLLVRVLSRSVAPLDSAGSGDIGGDHA